MVWGLCYFVSRRVDHTFGSAQLPGLRACSKYLPAVQCPSSRGRLHYIHLLLVGWLSTRHSSKKMSKVQVQIFAQFTWSSFSLPLTLRVFSKCLCFDGQEKHNFRGPLNAPDLSSCIIMVHVKQLFCNFSKLKLHQRSF